MSVMTPVFAAMFAAVSEKETGCFLASPMVDVSAPVRGC